MIKVHEILTFATNCPTELSAGSFINTMATSQGAATARERLRRISTTLVREPSVITLRDNTLSQDGEAEPAGIRRSIDHEQDLRAPLLSPFADQSPDGPQREPGAVSDLHWCECALRGCHPKKHLLTDILQPAGNVQWPHGHP